jgi:hypothetical protein
LVTVFQKEVDGVGADVAGTTGYEYFGHVSSSLLK